MIPRWLFINSSHKNIYTILRESTSSVLRHIQLLIWTYIIFEIIIKVIKLNIMKPRLHFIHTAIPSSTGPVTLPILQMRKPKLREVDRLGLKPHREEMVIHWDWTPNLPDTRTHKLNHCATGSYVFLFQRWGPRRSSEFIQGYSCGQRLAKSCSLWPAV